VKWQVTIVRSPSLVYRDSGGLFQGNQQRQPEDFNVENPRRTINHAKRLDQSGQTDAALDIIFDLIDEMLLADQFEQVDRTLVGSWPRDLSTDLLLAFLTATLPARERLPHLRAFVENVRQVLQDRDENVDGQLVGLE